MSTSTKSEITGKVVDLIDAVQAALPHAVTRGDINDLVRAAFRPIPVHAAGLIVPNLYAADVRKICRAAYNADQETLDALLWGDDVPQAVA